MIDVIREQLLTLNEAAALLPGNGGKPLSYSAIRRWASQGFRGVKLEAVCIGGKIVTSKEAIQRFTEELTIRSAPRYIPVDRSADRALREYLRNTGRLPQR